MKILLTIAFRNVFRQRRRTILTMLTMFGGFTLASISIAWSDGSYSNIIEMFTRNQLGHIQIHKKDYLDHPSLYKSIDHYRTIGKKVENITGVETWTARLYSAGLASTGEKTAGVRISGIDLKMEEQATNFQKKITAGKFFTAVKSKEALLGTGLSKILKAAPGDEVAIVTQAADGSIANEAYTIAGLVESGNSMTDQVSLYLELSDAQELLAMEGKVHEIAIIAEDADYVPELAREISAAVNDPMLKVSPWQEFASAFHEAMKADQGGMWISLLIIIMLVAVGVLNTVLMSVLERSREYGILKALGARPRQIFTLVLCEVSIMAAGSIIIGIGLSALINHFLSIHGISLPHSFSYGGVQFKTMYSEINIRSFTIPAATVCAAAALVAIFPAVRAGRTSPAKAMRGH